MFSYMFSLTVDSFAETLGLFSEQALDLKHNSPWKKMYLKRCVKGSPRNVASRRSPFTTTASLTALAPQT